MSLTSKHRFGFKVAPLHIRKGPRRYPLQYLKQRSSFWIAALSLIAFVAGNMVGQNGWYAFWKSVLGGYDDNLIVYTGTVAPIARVPDYERWSLYGGSPEAHTFRQVPEHLFMSLPAYKVASIHDLVYSVGHMGSYDEGTDGTGSHPGVDIRTPVGTPVVAIANGIVTDVRDDPEGFGQFIVIRHPHVPDPLHPKTTTVLHSVYAHLSAQLVIEGQVVQKGEEIGLSGQTGFATGPHLHFQLDLNEAPWHPYWPFTSAEARSAGLTLSAAVNQGLNKQLLEEYMTHPMRYVQANYPPLGDGRTVLQTQSTSSSVSSAQSVRQRALIAYSRVSALREERRQIRLARQRYAEEYVAKAAANPLSSSSPALVVRETVVALAEEHPPMSEPQDVSDVDIQHDGQFTRGWEIVRVTLLGDDGNIVQYPRIDRDLPVRAAYGIAEFRPERLSPLDFQNGVASVHVLPRGRRTLVINVGSFPGLSNPMRYVQQ